MSVLVIGDPHFKVSNIKETEDMSKVIVKKAEELLPDMIVVLGDVLDRHETIHVSPLTRSINFLNKLRNIAPLYVLMGNHDLKNNRQFLSDEHPFTALKFWDNTTIVDSVKTITIKDKLFVFVPYVPPGRFEEALNKADNWKEATCIFAHQEFKGCQMGPIVSVEGDKWPLEYPFVVSGHIHDYQELQNNILYTGTPIQHAFGDKSDKTISYFKFGEDRVHERIPLMLKMKKIVYITCADVTNYVPEKNSELKIVIKGTSGEIKAIMKHINIDAWKKEGHKISYKDVPLGKSETNEIAIKLNQRFSVILYGRINKNIRLNDIYVKIFGKINDREFRN
jgi:DNA repair exonuclease SbcCD nuclease subunit